MPSFRTYNPSPRLSSSTSPLFPCSTPSFKLSLSALPASLQRAPKSAYSNALFISSQARIRHFNLHSTLQPTLKQVPPMASLLFVSAFPLPVLRSSPTRAVSSRRPPKCVTPTPTPSPQDSPNELLIRSAMLNDLSAVETFLSQGASPMYASGKNDSSMTALMWAASEGNVEITRTLLQAGADPNMETQQGQTALIYAFENIPSANPRPPPPPGFPGDIKRRGEVLKQTWAGGARRTGHLGCIKMLLLAGADIKKKSLYGETVVHLAARKGQTEWVDIALTGGVEVDVRSIGYEESALHVACKEGHEAVCRMLLEAGGNVEGKSRYGWTPLVWAAACASLGCVKVLLEYGADPNTWTQGAGKVKATTALKEGERSAMRREVVRVLKRAGARE